MQGNMETANGTELSIQEQPEGDDLRPSDKGHYFGRPLSRALQSMRRNYRIAAGTVAVLMIAIIVLAAKWPKDVESSVIHKN